eukprot:143477-Rhodomonas_salina.2
MATTELFVPEAFTNEVQRQLDAIQMDFADLLNETHAASAMNGVDMDIAWLVTCGRNSSVGCNCSHSLFLSVSLATSSWDWSGSWKVL